MTYFFRHRKKSPAKMSDPLQLTNEGSAAEACVRFTLKYSHRSLHRM